LYTQPDRGGWRQLRNDIISLSSRRGVQKKAVDPSPRLKLLQEESHRTCTWRLCIYVDDIGFYFSYRGTRDMSRREHRFHARLDQKANCFSWWHHIQIEE
jgi:hypothetical protein